MSSRISEICRLTSFQLNPYTQCHSHLYSVNSGWVHLDDSSKSQVFNNRESPVENVMLWTDRHALTDLLHVFTNVKSSDNGSTMGWSIQA